MSKERDKQSKPAPPRESDQARQNRLFKRVSQKPGNKGQLEGPFHLDTADLGCPQAVQKAA